MTDTTCKVTATDGTATSPAADLAIDITAALPLISITDWPTGNTLTVGSDLEFEVTRTGDATDALNFTYTIADGSDAPMPVGATFAATMNTAQVTFSSGNFVDQLGAGAGDTITVALLASDHATAHPDTVSGSYTIPGSGTALTRTLTLAAPVPEINFKPNTFPTTLTSGQDVTVTFTRTGDDSASLVTGYQFNVGAKAFTYKLTFAENSAEVSLTLGWDQALPNLEGSNLSAGAGGNLAVTILASGDFALDFWSDPLPGNYTVGTPATR